jgi:hypothetical protein
MDSSLCRRVLKAVIATAWERYGKVDQVK